MPTSHLMRTGEKNIVIDCGLGVTGALARQDTDLTAIDAVFITHLHSDHYLELGPMLHTAWCAGLDRPVPVYGPSALAEYFDFFWKAMTFDIDLRIADEGRPDIRQLVELRPLATGTFTPFSDITCSAMVNRHPPIEESYALRFSAGGKSVVFSGDTAFMNEMIAFARTADLLVHEAMLTEGIEALCKRVGHGDDRLKNHLLTSHCRASDAGRIAREAGVHTLALNHFVPGDDPTLTEDKWRAEVEREWRGNLLIGRDGMVIPVGAT